MSSKRHQRGKECDRKVKHASSGAAHAALKALQKSPKFMGGVLGVYRCRHCTHWHVGHARGNRFLIKHHLALAALHK